MGLVNQEEKRKRVVFFYSDYESMGLEYISAVLQSNNIETSLVYKNLVDYYAGGSSEGIQEDRYKQIAREICALEPDVLGLSLLTDTFQANLSIAEEVKRISPEVKVLVGGVHATLLPRLTMQYHVVDALCIGDGELPTLEYVQWLDRIAHGERPEIEGIVYKDGGTHVGSFSSYASNKDLDALPLPDKELFYAKDPSMATYYYIQSARGCPYKCSYCINDFLSRASGTKPLRYRSVESVIDELETAKRRFHPRYVIFHDECFGVNRNHTRRLLDAYKQKIGLPFLISIHPHLVTQELADLLKAAKCWYAIIGVQTLNMKIAREVLNRPTDRTKVSNAIRLLKKNGILVKCDHIMGIPGETEEDMVDALRFYNKERPDIVSVFWLSYYPKSAILEFARERGLLSGKEIADIEHGRGLKGMKVAKGFYGAHFWLNYFTFFPKFFVDFIVSSGLFRYFNIKNYVISTGFPRALKSILNRKDFNRYILKRMARKKLANFLSWGSGEISKGGK
jgi:radical SAM superfamily enzyme YgiQ (UPF0313 family)